MAHTRVDLRCVLSALIFSALSHLSLAQDSINHTRPDKERLALVLGGGGIAYTSTMVALGKVWYSGYDREPFHFFNDAAEWNQTDKAGHFYSAFYLSSATQNGLAWAGVQDAKANIIGAATGFALLSSIELFDGRSTAYGASVSDLAVNLGGSTFYWAQKKVWKRIVIRPKFSFHFTKLAAMRPTVLGSGYEEIVKDYNGQTYWLSWSPHRLMNVSCWPAWLSVSFGYGTQNMIYARISENQQAGFDPFRQYYLSLDIDVDELNIRSKGLRKILTVMRFIKVPLPALEFSKHGAHFRPFYF